MSAYRRDFDKIKYMCFFIKDDELLEKHNEIWKKVRNNIKYQFDSEPVYKQKCLKINKNLTMEKSTQIFTIMKYQKKAHNVFIYQ